MDGCLERTMERQVCPRLERARAVFPLSVGRPIGRGGLSTFRTMPFLGVFPYAAGYAARVVRPVSPSSSNDNNREQLFQEKCGLIRRESPIQWCWGKVRGSFPRGT